MKRYLCIHGHFYQPPRENAWLQEIEFQDSAHPYHDWNERINAECYEPNTVTRITDNTGKIIQIVNNYEKISFNFGPTLLNWIERYSPHVYKAILEADRISAERFGGHGNALAQAYNHMIMPLANRKDKTTQVIWGIADFRKRFGRQPEGMWLPETAVDTETLDILSEHGIKFTILAPGQAKRVRTGGQDSWHDVQNGSVDTTIPYSLTLPSGRKISIFFYDGGMSHKIAFGGLLKSGKSFAESLVAATHHNHGHPSLINIATDGETYGHHHTFGEMALGYCIHHIEANNLAQLTNYAEFLEKYPPAHETEIHEHSAWSCAHGVERWKNDCGCNSGMNPGWNQKWRKPLRETLDWLREQLIHVYEPEASKYFRAPWIARNDYISVVLARTEENADQFFRNHASHDLSKEEKVRSLNLLEMQRNAMLMYTSCGWFFDEVSGIETTQIIQYASKAIQYAEEVSSLSLEQEFSKRLESIPSNVYKNATEVYDKFIKPSKIDLLRVGAHYSISSVFEEYPEATDVYSYTVKRDVFEKTGAGNLNLAIGKATITSQVTWDERKISFAVLHLGDHNINAGVKNFQGDEDFDLLRKEISEAFEKGDVPDAIRTIDKHFSGNIYSLWHLFRDEQRRVLNQILQLTYEAVESSYRQIYENNYAVMNFYNSLHQRIPVPLQFAAEYIVDTDLKKCFEDESIDMEKLNKLIDETQRLSLSVDKTTLGFIVNKWVGSLMEKLNLEPEDEEALFQMTGALKALTPLSLSLNLWKSQSMYFSIYKNTYDMMKEKADGGGGSARKWVEGFRELGDYLKVKV